MGRVCATALILAMFAKIKARCLLFDNTLTKNLHFLLDSGGGTRYKPILRQETEMFSADFICGPEEKPQPF